MPKLPFKLFLTSPATPGHIFIHTVWESLLLMFSKTEQHFKSLNGVCLSHWYITFCKAALKPCSLCSFDFINLHLSQMLSCIWQLLSRSLRYYAICTDFGDLSSKSFLEGPARSWGWVFPEEQHEVTSCSLTQSSWLNRFWANQGNMPK